MMTEQEKNQIVGTCFTYAGAGVLVYNKKMEKQLVLHITDKIRMQKTTQRDQFPIEVCKPTEMLEKVLDFIKDADFDDLEITFPYKLEVDIWDKLNKK